MHAVHSAKRIRSRAPIDADGSRATDVLSKGVVLPSSHRISGITPCIQRHKRAACGRTDGRKAEGPLSAHRAMSTSEWPSGEAIRPLNIGRPDGFYSCEAARVGEEYPYAVGVVIDAYSLNPLASALLLSATILQASCNLVQDSRPASEIREWPSFHALSPDSRPVKKGRRLPFCLSLERFIVMWRSGRRPSTI